MALRTRLLFAGAFAAVFGGLNIPLPASAPAATPLEQGGPFDCWVAWVHDGQTWTCEERDANGDRIQVQLSGIAARESDGTCKPGRPCPGASAESAKVTLRKLAQGQKLQCEWVGTTAGRRAAFCHRSDGKDLSCAMKASGTVEVWPKYWGSHECGTHR